MVRPIVKLVAAALASVIPFTSGCSTGKRTDPNALEFSAPSDFDFSKLHDVISFKRDPDSGKVFVEVDEDTTKVTEKLTSLGFTPKDISSLNLWAERFNTRAISLQQSRLSIDFHQLYSPFEQGVMKLKDDLKDKDRVDESFVHGLPHPKKAITVEPFENPFSQFDLLNGPQEIYIRPSAYSVRHMKTTPLSITLPDNVRFSHSFGTPASEYYVMDHPLTYDSPTVRQGVRFDLTATVGDNEERTLHMYAPSRCLPFIIDTTKDERYIIGLETMGKIEEKVK